MKNFLLTLFISFTTVAFGQTAAHKQVPGTKCSLVPPAGFVPATSFNGFQHNESGSSIMITQMAGPYSKIVAGFVPENLAKQGMTMAKKEVVDFNGNKALSIKLSQKANGMDYLKEMLVIGNESTTVMVIGTYPETSKNMEATIHKALFSTVYDEKKNDDPVAAANFTIDVTGSDFKIDKTMSGMVIYKMDDEIPSKKPTLLAGQSIGKVISTDLKQYAINRVKKLPDLQQAEIKAANPITIDGLSGYEIVALNKNKDDVAEQTYVAMLFKPDNGYFIIVGKAQADLEMNLNLFKKIASTFKQK
ncbi:hypothetical protein [Pedobacter ginsengisoli]|uniref:hypothetical protein n=1 Tax=Pedobacter ginsengisoli TaxID=363852 RepID=UPI00254B0073|nr:hypothetical protein [Pedobacter ginsengisoli]